MLPPLSAAETSREPPVCRRIDCADQIADRVGTVDVYVNSELMPSLIVIVWPELIPSDASVALDAVLTVPVPVATASGRKLRAAAGDDRGGRSSRRAD